MRGTLKTDARVAECFSAAGRVAASDRGVMRLKTVSAMKEIPFW